MIKKIHREDLYALRGFAILAVVMFHLNIENFFRNGHFGVDIFFVLSGYFIFSSHLCNCPLIDFFSKRIWRIFPGFFLCLFILAFAAQIILVAKDFPSFLHDLMKAACFVSNVKLNTEKGYFEKVQEHSFLLHTWSLSLEIQFYIISPVIAFLLRKLGWKSVFAFIALSAGSQYFFEQNVAFYSLPCRIWQFLFGFVAFHLSSELNSVEINKVENDKTEASIHKNQDFLKTLCVFSIVAVCLMPSSPKTMPWQRIMITILTCYFVSSSSSSFFAIDYFWKNDLFQFFGVISFSWYLWHWPFTVCFTYFNVDIKNPANLAIIIIIPFSIASFSTFFVERPFIQKQHGNCSTLSIAILPIALIFLYSLIFHQLQKGNDGEVHLFKENFTSFNSPFEATHNQTKVLKFDPNVSDGLKLFFQVAACSTKSGTDLCFIGEKNSTNHTLIWGDSHAQSAYAAHAVLSNEYEKSRITLVSRGGCRPFFDCNYINTPICKENITRDYADIKQLGINRAILASHYIASFVQILQTETNRTVAQNILRDCVNSTVTHLLAIGVQKILLLQPIPGSQNQIPQQLEKTLKFGWKLELVHIERSRHEREVAEIKEVMKNVADACIECSLLDPASVLCNEFLCPTFFVDGEFVRPLYYDNNHLNDFGIFRLSQLFVQKHNT